MCAHTHKHTKTHLHTPLSLSLSLWTGPWQSFCCDCAKPSVPGSRLPPCCCALAWPGSCPVLIHKCLQKEWEDDMLHVVWASQHFLPLCYWVLFCISLLFPCTILVSPAAHICPWVFFKFIMCCCQNVFLFDVSDIHTISLLSSILLLHFLVVYDAVFFPTILLQLFYAPPQQNRSLFWFEKWSSRSFSRGHTLFSSGLIAPGEEHPPHVWYE